MKFANKQAVEVNSEFNHFHTSTSIARGDIDSVEYWTIIFEYSSRVR